MKTAIIIIIIIVSGMNLSSEAQMTATYRPLRSWTDPSANSISRWESNLHGKVNRGVPVRQEARPQIAGLRSKDVELLQDGFLRRHPKLLTNSAFKSRELILRRFNKGMIPQLRGYMAEAIFLEKKSGVGLCRQAQCDPTRCIFQISRSANAYQWAN